MAETLAPGFEAQGLQGDIGALPAIEITPLGNEGASMEEFALTALAVSSERIDQRDVEAPSAMTGSGATCTATCIDC